LTREARSPKDPELVFEMQTGKRPRVNDEKMQPKKPGERAQSREHTPV